jgi:hypothetical protein
MKADFDIGVAAMASDGKAVDILQKELDDNFSRFALRWPNLFATSWNYMTHSMTFFVPLIFAESPPARNLVTYVHKAPKPPCML